MGRLGASNVNVNVNVAAGGLSSTGGMPVRYNAHEFRKEMRLGRFPHAPEPGKEAEFRDARDAANRVRFREYWDAELRAYVYLNEFVTRNPDWLGKLTGAIDKERLHERLHSEKGEQLLKVIEASGDREERFVEIIDQHEGEGAIKYWLGMLMIDGASSPATNQLIRVARRIGDLVVMCLKEHYREARPSQVCPAIVPMIDPPVTPAFPAGHALQSHLISKCLEAAERPQNQRELLFALSRRVAENRVIAGLHYPLDNDAGVLAADACFDLMRDGKEFKALRGRARAEGNPEAQA